ncbi:MAG: MFS transporter, partial [Planctomycetaceae bacterium]
MNASPTNAEKIRRLPFVIAFDAFNATFCQLSVLGSVFILFLSELGLPKGRIGLILSLVPFASVGAILLAPLAARIGVKRVFITFWGTRNIFAAIILLTPWVYWWYGSDTALIFIIILMACFSLCRAFGEAASTQWRQDIIPHNLRGRFSGINNIICTLASVAALMLASTVLSSSGSLWRYIILMGVGTLIGGASIIWASLIPGGMEVQKPKPVKYHTNRFGKVVRDRNFLMYIVALSFVTFGMAPLGVFIPLFLKEQVGIKPSDILMVQNTALIGTLISSYFWGWAADRFGSKPVILTGLCLLMIGPISWLAIPYHSAWSIPAAVAIFGISGVASIGYALGTGRQLYVTIVPPRRKTHYMSIFCAWNGMTSGLGQLLAGQSMDLAAGISGQFMGLRVNPYMFLFLFSLTMLIIGLSIQSRVKADGSVTIRRFMGMFMHGNPLMAAESLMRYNRAADETGRVRIIRRLGRTRSPLSADELAQAMEDPSFSVRYEAITAAARTRPSSQLTANLVETLIGGQADLSMTAAWALGRIGDHTAIAPLRWTLANGSPLLQLRSARALVAMGDASIKPELLRRAGEGEPALRPAYESTLRSLEKLGGSADAHKTRLKIFRSRPGVAKLLKMLGEDDFNIQYEAIVLASHRLPTPQLRDALVGIMRQGQPDLSIEAAWALGRMGDLDAVEPLIEAFNCSTPLLQARCARALAHLGRQSIVPELRRRLTCDTD